ncbi:MAG: metallophosphoesterase [Nanoarchaeota archaeon]|nr:metallophosphoesterase [Nanoarchaeota archaeon]
MKKTLKNILKFAMIPALVYTLGSCEKQKTLKINNSTYDIHAQEIIQTKSSFLEDDTIKIGVVSDIEGAIQNAQVSAKKLQKEKVDVLIISGDCYENESIRRNPLYPNSTNNLEEMIAGIKPYAEIGALVLIIPGNHEKKDIYKKAINKLKEDYPNVFDIKNKSVDLKDFNIVGMGGYHDSRFMDSEGFLLEKGDYEKALNSLQKFQNQNEPTIFVTHSPPKSNSKIDYVHGAGNVGDSEIEKIMNNKSLDKIVNVHGHIHEGGRNVAKYKSGVALNVASITSYMNQKGVNTPLLIIKDNDIQYKEL